MEGLEPSPDMLALCAEKAAAAGLSPVVHAADLAGFAPPHPYAAALLPAFTFQLLPDPAAALASLRQLLAPGGLLYLTVFLPFAEIDSELPEDEWYLDHELDLAPDRRATVHTRHRLDRDGQILRREHRYQLHEPGRVSEHLSRQTLRWFSPVQLHRLLTDAGFIPDRAVGDFDEDLPADEDAQILTVVALRD